MDINSVIGLGDQNFPDGVHELPILCIGLHTLEPAYIWVKNNRIIGWDGVEKYFTGIEKWL